MTSSIHFFGQFANGYSQFPTDFTQEQFETILKQAKAKVELHVQRHGDIVSYIYLRKFTSKSKTQWLGVCCDYNGVYTPCIKDIFLIFEDEYARCATKGFLLEYDDDGNIVSSVDSLYKIDNELQIVSAQIKSRVDNVLAQKSQPLPSQNYANSISERKILIFNQLTEEDFNNALANFSNITIVKDSSGAFESESERGFATKIRQKSEELKNAQKNIQELSKEVAILKNKQRNTTWVSIFAIVAVILGVIVWNNVLFPKEVTHKQMPEYVYYGPVKNKTPHGVGVAIYPNNDTTGRRYYVGNFDEGNRSDSMAMLLYQDGSVFLGNIECDSLRQGMLFNASDGTAYIGTFRENQPLFGDLFLLDPLLYYENGVLRMDLRANRTEKQKKDKYDSARRRHLKSF